mgnify:FL=1
MVVLDILLTLIKEIKIPDVMKDPASWVNLVERCKTVYDTIVDPHDVDYHSDIISNCR